MAKKKRKRENEKSKGQKSTLKYEMACEMKTEQLTLFDNKEDSVAVVNEHSEVFEEVKPVEKIEPDASKTEKKKKIKKPKVVYSKFEKRKMKRKKQEDLLNMRGIPKYFTTFFVEMLYIFAVEIFGKFLFGNLVLDWTLLRILLSSGLLSLVLTVFTNNLPLKFRRGCLVFVNFLIVLYAWLQLGFMNFLGTYMSIGNAEQGAKITEYVFEFLSSYDLLLHTVFIPFIFSILYLVFERNITRDGFEAKIEFKILIQDVAIIVFGAILGFLYYATLEVDFMQNKYQTVSNKELFSYPSNPAMAIKNFGTTVYFILDVKGTIFGGDNPSSVVPGISEDEPPLETDNTRHIDDTAWESLIKVEEDPSYKTLNNYFINRTSTDKNEYTGMFEGKNLVMVMLESVGEAVFSEEYKDYFPTLYKLYSEGITGVNHYSPRNNCATGESEVSSQNSLYPIPTSCSVNTYKNNEYRQALLYMLRAEGYYTSSYHDYTDMYYTRSVYSYKLGSMRYYGIDELDVYYEAPYAEWPSDLEFFEKALPKFIDQEKFASVMVTVTPHTPYIFSSKIANKNMKLFEDLDFPIQTKRYLSKLKETDLALEHLLKTLEEKDILDDTVIVVFGDHYPYGLTDKLYQQLTDRDISEGHEVDRTPFIIYNSETDAEKITKYMTPLDITPTLLNLFGVEFDPRYYFGHDVFSDYTNYIAFPDNSWQSPYGYYNAVKGEFVPAVDVEEQIDDEEIIRINKEIIDAKNMSALATKKNYFNYLFKYFDEYAKLEQEKNEDDEADDEEDDKDKDEKDKKDTEE